MKRVKSAGKVSEVIIEISDNEEWTFAVDMAFTALLIEDGRDLSGMMDEFRNKPVSSLAEVLYYGLKDRQPEITLSDVRRRIVPSEALISAVMESFFSFFPEADAAAGNPTMPPMWRKKKGRAG